MNFPNILLLSLVLLCSQTLAESTDPTKIDLKTKKVILKYTGDKLEPAKLDMYRLDSSVFFLNQSENKDVNIEVDFNGKKVHCHSDNFKLDNGVLKTQHPIKARDFEILCFPTAGTYKYSVTETGLRGKKLEGEIVIHE